MSYYTDCLYFCEGLSEKRTGIWPFRGKSEMDRCRDDCNKSGKYETQQTQFETGFHREGVLDVDIYGDVSAAATWGPDTSGLFGGGGGGNGQGYTDEAGNYIESRQGDPTLMLGAAGLILGLLYLGMRK
jgi:hypothetical protein